MIDLYDVLGIGLDADTEEIKKVHPDKVNASSVDSAEGGGRSREELFNEVKQASDCLKDPGRRKIYDTFGYDPGEETPEMELWNIGFQSMLSPVASFALKTVCSRIALWLVTFRWIRYILIASGFGLGGFYGMNVNIGSLEIRSPDFMPVLVNVGLANIIVVLFWLWPLLAESIGVLYLVSDVIGLHVFIDNRKVGISLAVGIIVFAWLAQARWFWIIGFEVGLAIFLLFALTVSVGSARIWIDQVQATKGEKLKEFRFAWRKERKTNADDIADKKRKLQAQSLLSNPALVEAHRKKLVEQTAYWENKMKTEAANKSSP